MKIDDLPEILEQYGVSRHSYHLNGPGPGDEYCIEQTPAGWEVYYHERGCKKSVMLFSDEHQACAGFLSRIIGDPTTRREE
jgi:hypothetical protein